MRRHRLLLAVLTAFLGLGTPWGVAVGADEPKPPAQGPVEEVDLDRAVDALRYLFADPAWRVSTTGAPVPDPRTTGLNPAPARRWEIPGAGVDSRAVSAWVLGGSQVACLWLTVYETETAARDAVDTRTRLAKRDRVDMRVVATDDFEVGAGPGGELPGYTTHLVTVQQGTTSVLDVHAVAIGRMTLELSLRDAPEIDRVVQDAAISRLATLLRDPKAKAAMPAPKPPVLGIATRPLTILVTDGEGHPVPRALATVGWVRFPVTAGKLETILPRVPSRVDVWAAADENGTPLPLAPVFDVELGADPERLEIHLPAGATIDGRVLDADATPLAGLTVEALPRGTHREEPRANDPSVRVHARATSDDAGRFHLVGLAKVPYVLFLLDGRTVVSRAPIDAMAGDADAVLQRAPGHDPTITVLDSAARPLADVDVALSKSSPGGEPLVLVRARTDANGQVRLRRCNLDERYRLELTPPASRRDLIRTRFDDWKPSAQPISLAPGYVVRGVTVDDQGEPVKSRVRLQPLLAGSEARELTTGDDGRFEFVGVPLGRAWFSARDASAPTTDVLGLEAPTHLASATPEKPTVTIVVAHEFPVRVRILDDEGRPTTHGASVAIEALGFSTSYVLPGSEWSTSVGAGPFAVRVSGARREDGLGLTPWARAGIPQGTTLVEMRLQRAIDVTGRVTDDRGQPVVGAILEARSPGDEHRGSSSRRRRTRDANDPGSDVVTDREGRFRIECLAAAPYRILATPRDGAARFLQPAVQGGETDVDLTLPATVQSTVTVVGRGDRPLADARVTVLRRTSLDAPVAWIKSVVASVTTDRSGIARLPGLVPDPEYELRIEPPPGETELSRSETRPGTLIDTRVELEVGSLLRGRVLSADGAPAPGARVFASRVGEEWLARCQAGPDGAFELHGRMTFPEQVLAVQPGWGRRVGLDAPWTLVKYGVDDVTLHLPPAPSGFKVHVAGGGGREGYLLGPGDLKTRLLYTFELDADGNAVFPALPPGALSIWILPSLDDPRTAYKVGVPSSDGSASLTLAEPLSIRIHLALPDDVWIDDLNVAGPMGSRTPWRRLREGLYEAWGLPSGTYHIDVSVRSPSTKFGYDQVDAAAGTDVTLKPR